MIILYRTIHKECSRIYGKAYVIIGDIKRNNYVRALYWESSRIYETFLQTNLSLKTLIYNNVTVYQILQLLWTNSLSKTDSNGLGEKTRQLFTSSTYLWDSHNFLKPHQTLNCVLYNTISCHDTSHYEGKTCNKYELVLSRSPYKRTLRRRPTGLLMRQFVRYRPLGTIPHVILFHEVSTMAFQITYQENTFSDQEV